MTRQAARLLREADEDATQLAEAIGRMPPGHRRVFRDFIFTIDDLSFREAIMADQDCADLVRALARVAFAQALASIATRKGGGT